jgi:hypothetical protein
MTAQLPDIGSNNLAHKGPRYIVVEFSDEGSFGDYGKSDADYVLWDCENGGSIALFSKSGAGRYVGQIITHVGWTDREYDSMAEAVAGFAEEYEEYMNGVMGPLEE